LDGSPRTLPTRADEAGGTAVKFYEPRDNLGVAAQKLRRKATRVGATGVLGNRSKTKASLAVAG